MTDPIAHLLASAAKPALFPPNSRYAATPTATFTAADGRVIVYLRRRFIPPPELHALVREHAVRAGERIDTIAAGELGDPELAWRLADAAGAMRREELEIPGRLVPITLPAGIPGAAPNP
jgi:hypothetical protein